MSIKKKLINFKIDKILQEITQKFCLNELQKITLK